MALGQAEKIFGWMSGPELQFLADTATKSKKILEIGSYRGKSTRVMADHTAGIIYCVDPGDGKWQAYIKGVFYNGNSMDYSLFCANVGSFIKAERIKVFRTEFQQLELDEKFDFIFIDALHDYENCKADILKCLPMMKEGGILTGHDYCPGWPGVIQAVEELLPNRELTDSIWHIRIPT